jgi:hypothetical protein
VCSSYERVYIRLLSPVCSSCYTIEGILNLKIKFYIQCVFYNPENTVITQYTTVLTESVSVVHQENNTHRYHQPPPLSLSSSLITAFLLCSCSITHINVINIHIHVCSIKKCYRRRLHTFV